MKKTGISLIFSISLKNAFLCPIRNLFSIIFLTAFFFCDRMFIVDSGH